MKRRLEIARALLGEPRILFLDEPTLGLDPIVRAELWETVRTLCRERQVTVLVSTHYLEEAQGVCHRVAIVDRGQIIELDTPSALVGALGSHILEVGVDGDPAPILEALAASDQDLGRPFRSGTAISIPSNLPAAALTEVGSRLGLTERGAITMTVRPATLNDVFLHLTGPSDLVPAAVPA